MPVFFIILKQPHRKIAQHATIDYEIITFVNRRKEKWKRARGQNRVSNLDGRGGLFGIYFDLRLRYVCGDDFQGAIVWQIPKCLALLMLLKPFLQRLRINEAAAVIIRERSPSPN